MSIPAYGNGVELQRLPHRRQPLSLPKDGSELNADFLYRLILSPFSDDVSVLIYLPFNAESAGGGREHPGVYKRYRTTKTFTPLFATRAYLPECLPPLRLGGIYLPE